MKALLVLLLVLLVMWALFRPARQKGAEPEAKPHLAGDDRAARADDPVLTQAQSEAFARAKRNAAHAHAARDAALNAPPNSVERRTQLASAESAVRQLEAFAERHPWGRITGLADMRAELSELADNRSPAAPLRFSPLPSEGSAIVAFVDTETTGLTDRDEPITLGIVLAEVSVPKGHLIRYVDEYYGMREPSVPIHPEAAVVHGLSATELRGKEFDLDRVATLLQQAHVLVAHNATFDRRMLARVLPDVARAPWRCSVKQPSWPSEVANRRLDTICAHFAVKRPLPHNALSDAKAMAECLLQLSGKTARSKSYLGACLSARDW